MPKYVVFILILCHFYAKSEIYYSISHQSFYYFTDNSSVKISNSTIDIYEQQSQKLSTIYENNSFSNEIALSNIISKYDYKLNLFINGTYEQFLVFKDKVWFNSNSHLVEIENTANLLNIINIANFETKTLTTQDFQIKLSNSSIDFIFNDLNNKSSNSTQSSQISYLFGGEGFDSGDGFYYADNGDKYICGSTNSRFLPFTVGAVQRFLKVTSNDEPDAFVSCIDINGNLKFSTYLGSNQYDAANCIGINAEGNVVVTGISKFNQFSFPVTDSVISNLHNGNFDIFVSILTPLGDSLVASTFIGGAGDDFVNSMYINEFDDILLAGNTVRLPDTTQFPFTDMSFQTTNRGRFDAFALRISSKLDTVLASTLYGGTSDDYGQSIKQDQDGNIYLAGVSRSNNLITTDDAYSRIYKDLDNTSKSSDGFVAVFDSSLSSLQYGTYFGGSKKDIIYCMELDSDGSIIIAGSTESRDMPTSLLAYDDKFNNDFDLSESSDCFVAKIKGNQLLGSTFIGGENSESIYDIYLNKSDGTISATGQTNSVDFPVSEFALQENLADDGIISDAFVVKLNSELSALYYSTYLGGLNSDVAYFVHDDSNKFTIGGTTSSNEIGNTDSTNLVKSGGDIRYHAFISEFEYSIGEIFDFVVCQGVSTSITSNHSLSGASFTYSWQPTMFFSQPDSQFTEITLFSNQSVTFNVTNDLGENEYRTMRIKAEATPNPIIVGMQQVIENDVVEYEVIGKPRSNFTWFVSGGQIISQITNNKITVRFDDFTNAYLQVEETDFWACTGTSNTFPISLAVPRFEIKPFGSFDLCEGDTVLLDAGALYESIVWNRGAVGRFDTVFAAGAYSFNAIRISDGAEISSNNAIVRIIPKPPVPEIRYTNGEFRCLTISDNYQWYSDGIKIVGANQRRYTAQANGYHSVEVAGTNGCKSMSDTLWGEALGVSVINNNTLNHVEILHKNDYIEVKADFISIDIFDILGNKFHSENNKINKSISIIDISSYPAGVYIIKVSLSDTRLHHEKIIIQ